MPTPTPVDVSVCNQPGLTRSCLEAIRLLPGHDPRRADLTARLRGQAAGRAVRAFQQRSSAPRELAEAASFLGEVEQAAGTGGSLGAALVEAARRLDQASASLGACKPKEAHLLLPAPPFADDAIAGEAAALGRQIAVLDAAVLYLDQQRLSAGQAEADRKARRYDAARSAIDIAIGHCDQPTLINAGSWPACLRDEVSALRANLVKLRDSIPDCNRLDGALRTLDERARLDPSLWPEAAQAARKLLEGPCDLPPIAAARVYFNASRYLACEKAAVDAAQEWSKAAYRLNVEPGGGVPISNWYNTLPLFDGKNVAAEPGFNQLCSRAGYK